MSFSDEQKNQIDKLVEFRYKIVQIIDEIESTLQIYFPQEFANAHQHWIAQVETALFNDTEWLPRGQFTMQDTINRLIDKSKESNQKGVSKYI